MIVSGMTAPHRQNTLACFCSKLIRRWPMVIATVFGLLIVAGVVSARPSVSRPVAPAATPKIAVLPVEAPPGVLNVGLAEMGHVLTESIIGKLQSMTGRHAVVLTKSETAELRGEQRTLAGVVRLGAEYLVDVSLRQTAGTVRVHAQLANVSGSILWSTDYDLEPADLEPLQLTVAQRIARRVAEEVVPSATRIASLLPGRGVAPSAEHP
jgi:TolB-like protein